MKKQIKAFSLVMALVIAFSTLMIPVSAATLSGVYTKLSANVTKVVGETDTNGLKSEDNGIYKLKIMMHSNRKVPSIFLQIDYDMTKLGLIEHNGGTRDYTYLCEKSYPNISYNPLGFFADANGYDAAGNVVAGRPAYFGPLHPQSKDSVELFIKDYKLDTIQLSYTPGDKTMIPGGTVEGEEILEMYFKLLPGKTDADIQGMTFALHDVQTAIDNNPTNLHFYNNMTSTADNAETVSATSCIYNPAPVVTGPKLAKANSQIKFYGTKPTADNNFDYRLISKITDADWTTYFANTGVVNATKNAITEAGFVALDKKDGTFNLETAKSVAKGTPATGYKTASTTYVSKTGAGDATFGCRITDVLHSTQATDIDCLAYVKYLDNAGTAQYIFYDAAFTAAVSSNYATALNAWQNAA